MSIRVSPADSWLLGEYDWKVTTQGYAARNVTIDGRKHVIFLHRVIMNAPQGMVVDHIDGDKLNNTRENLRICTHAENVRNRKRSKINACGYKGVYLDKSKGLYRATIKADKRRHSLGYYRNAEDAHRAYVQAAERLHGEFARSE